MIASRFTKFSRALALVLAITSVSAFAVECISLLHTNLTTVTVDFKKKIESNPLEEGGHGIPSVRVFSAASDDGFYASNGTALGYVDAKTGKFTPLVAPGKATYLNVTDSDSGFLFGSYSPAKKTEFKAPEPKKEPGLKGGGGEGPRFVDAEQSPYVFYFVNKETKKAVTTRPFSPKSVSDHGWEGSKASFYPVVEDDQLRIVDIRTGEIRTHELPFVPTTINTVGPSGAVVITAPGKSPLVVDMNSGKTIPIRGLNRIKFGKLGKNAQAFQIHISGERVAFRNTMRHPTQNPMKDIAEFDIDLRTKSIRMKKPRGDHYYVQETHADGRLEVYFNRDAFFPPPAPKEASSEAMNPETFNTQCLLVDGKTGRSILPPSNFFQITDGVGQASIRSTSAGVVGEKSGFREHLHLFDNKTGELKPLTLPEGQYFIEQTAYDEKRQRWLVSLVGYGPQGQPGKNSILLYKRDGTLTDQFSLGANLLAVDSRSRFVGLMSQEWAGGNTFTKLNIPVLATKPRVPVEGWSKAVRRLGSLLNGKDSTDAYPELLAYFKKKIYLKYPESASGAFLNLFSVSNLYAGRILTENPGLIEIMRKHPIDLSTLSARSYTAQKRATANFLKILLGGGNFLEANTGYFHALKPFLERTPIRTIEDTVDRIAESFKNQAMQEEPLLSEVFESTVYKLARHSFSDTFGLKEGPIRTVTDVQANNELKFVALSSGEIEGGKKTRFGVSYKEMESYKIGPEIGPNKVIAKKEIAFVDNGERFTAKITAKTSTRTMADIVKFTDAPEYAKLMKNKKLTTAIVTGSNLISDSADVLGEYLQAFRDRGYQFDKDADIPDLFAFLKEKIESGDIDLFIKEAHSDGDEKNLFRIFKTSTLKVGRKILPNGEEEIVYLIYPKATATETAEDTTTRLISNVDFGEWMRAREKIDVPFYYLNSSCWSKTKARAEIQAASSPILVELPSLTSMDTFVYEKNTVMYQTVFGILDRRTFDQIEASFALDPSVATGENNILLLPSTSGKERFLKEVMEGFKQPIVTTIEMFDSQGRPTHIDQQ